MRDNGMWKLRRRVREAVLREQMIPKGGTVLLGLSGGADSVCLLGILASLREELRFTLYAMHVQHGIRGEEALRDMRFSEEMAERFAVPFFTETVDAPALAKEQGLGLEEAARILRYRALREKLASLTGSGQDAPAGRIAVAHHLDDQAETVVHHLVRGSGLRGLGGMAAENISVIRPLLSVRRRDILEALTESRVPYVTDSTNLDPAYTRNRIRNEILPALETLNPQAVQHIASAAQQMAEADRYFRELAEQLVSGQVEALPPGCMALRPFQEEADSGVSGEASLRGIRISVKALQDMPQIVRRYVMMELVRRTGTPEKDWTSRHYTELEQLPGRQGGAHLDLPGQLTAEYRGGWLWLLKRPEVLSVRRKEKDRKKQDRGT